MWDHMPISDHRNVYDLQRMAAIETIDREIEEAHANGYGLDVDALLERRQKLVELIRTGPHS